MKRAILTLLAVLVLVTASLAGGQPVPSLSGREAEIRRAVMEFVQEKTANLGCQISIRRLAINGSPTFPEGNLEYEVMAPKQWEGWGSAGISIIVRQGGRVVRNVSARVTVEALAEVVVTSRYMDRGSLISDGDVALRRVDLASVQGRYLSRIEDAVGKKARITLRANAPLRSDQLEREPLVKTGQLVTIVAENENMRITVTGKAKGSGAEGDTITVQNLNSLRELRARVVDAGTVQIVF